MIKGKFILPLGGAGGKTAEFQVSGGWLQWRYADQSPADTWKDLIEIPSDGKSPEMRYFEGWFQWRYAGQTPEDIWKDLVEISLDGDITINEYGYWRLTIEPSADELDADADLDPETIQIGSMEQLSMQGDGTVRLILDSIERRLTIVGASIEFMVENNWLYYRYVYDSTAMDADEGWIPIVEMVFADSDLSAGEDGKTPELREHEGDVQWRYANQTPEDTWVSLYTLPTGTTITGFDASVAAGTRPAPGNNQTVRIRITESNATTHDIFLGGQAGLNWWHGTQAGFDAIATKDANTIYYINEPI